MKVYLGGQKFQSDDELRRGVLWCLHSEKGAFHAADIKEGKNSLV
jgi:hypothetical protein